MSNYKIFFSQSEEESQWVENYNNLSKYISDRLKEVDEKDRFTVLKETNLSDLSLMNLFLQSLKNEDYEICEVANRLLKERGLEFKSDKW
jgi:RNA polymerase-binding transcription factor DksA